MKLYEINLLAKDQEIFEKISKAVGRMAKIKKTVDFGQKKLAFPIKKERLGFLRSLWIEADQKTLTKLRELLNQTEGLLRWLILAKLDWQLEELSASQKLEERAKAAAPAKLKSQLVKKKKIEKRAEAKAKPAPKPKPVKAETEVKAKTKVKAEKADNSEKRLKALDKKLAQILKE